LENGECVGIIRKHCAYRVWVYGAVAMTAKGWHPVCELAIIDNRRIDNPRQLLTIDAIRSGFSLILPQQKEIRRLKNHSAIDII
jgi:hypothetical protein